ncbi:MAG: response regulator [Leptolyngbyaceae bacterium]|nr:response regulator [Leptolyngbyaceae bacterium]
MQPTSSSSASSHLSKVDPHLGERNPLRILVAEDHPVNQKMALLLLKRLGYRADVAENGLEVLAALQHQSYDVVLMDVQMPEMDGLMATQQICQLWPSETRPRIIAMTANVMQSDRQKCMEAGMSDFIPKPVELEKLASALQESHPIGKHLSSPASVPERPAIEEQALEEIQAIAGEDANMILVDLIDTYLETSTELLQKMLQAIALGDAVQLAKIAHTLKSSSQSLGATSLSQLCQQLEALGKSNQLELLPTTVQAIQTEAERVKTALLKKRQQYQAG